MKIDNSKLSDTQFLFTVACFIQSSSMLASFMVPIALHETWLITVIGIVVCIPLIWLYRSIMVSYPDKNLVQLLEAAYGTVAGKILGLLYAWFLMTINALSLLDMGVFTKLMVMVRTPDIVLAVICILISSYAVRHGLGVVTRYSMLFSVFSCFIIILSVFLVMDDFSWENLLPFATLPLPKVIQCTHIVATMPIGEAVTFLMITPNLNLNKRNVSRYLLLGYAIGMITILIVVLRDIAVLGNTMRLFTLPSLIVLRLITIGEALSRMEVLFAIGLVILFFFKISFQQYVSVITVAQVFKVRNYRNLVLPMGALLINYGLTLYPNSVIHNLSAQETIPFIWSVFQMVIPLVTFIVLKVRKIPGKKEA